MMAPLFYASHVERMSHGAYHVPMTDKKTPPLVPSPEDMKALKAHRRQLDHDIDTGRMRPGERRCVTLPSGARFYLEHPDAYPMAAVKRSWWSRLISRVRR